MIQDNNKLPRELFTLNSSKFEFHLTGSRYFGTANEYSDWDFFVQDSEEVRQFLLNNGFQYNEKELKEPAYSDENTARVFSNTLLNSQQIDIQLQYDVERRVKAQLILEQLVNFKQFKYEIKNLLLTRVGWELAYKLVRSINDSK